MYGTAQFCTLRYNFLNYDIFLSMKVVLILANNADTICQSTCLWGWVSSMQMLRLVMTDISSGYVTVSSAVSFF